MSRSLLKPSLSRAQSAALVGVLVLHLLVSLFTPSRPYFVGSWHLALALAVLGAALIALVGWARAKFGVPARPHVRWKVAFWLLWLTLAVLLVPAVSLHLSQASYLPLVRLLSNLVVPMVGVYILLHLAKVQQPDGE